MINHSSSISAALSVVLSGWDPKKTMRRRCRTIRREYSGRCVKLYRLFPSGVFLFSASIAVDSFLMRWIVPSTHTSTQRRTDINVWSPAFPDLFIDFRFLSFLSVFSSSATVSNCLTLVKHVSCQYPEIVVEEAATILHQNTRSVPSWASSSDSKSRLSPFQIRTMMALSIGQILRLPLRSVDGYRTIDDKHASFSVFFPFPTDNSPSFQRKKHRKMLDWKSYANVSNNIFKNISGICARSVMRTTMATSI